MFKYSKNDHLSTYKENDDLTAINLQLHAIETRQKGIENLANWFCHVDMDEQVSAVCVNGKRWLLSIHAILSDNTADQQTIGYCLYIFSIIIDMISCGSIGEDFGLPMKKLLNEQCLLKGGQVCLEIINTQKVGFYCKAALLFLEQSLLKMPCAFIVMKNPIWDVIFDLLTSCSQDELAKSYCMILSLTATLGNARSAQTKAWFERFDSIFQRCGNALNFLFCDVERVEIPVRNQHDRLLEGASNLDEMTVYLNNMLLLLQYLLHSPGIQIKIPADIMMHIVLGGLDPFVKLKQRNRVIGQHYWALERALLQFTGNVIKRFGTLLSRSSDEFNKTLLLLLKTACDDEVDQIGHIFCVIQIWITECGMLTGLDRCGCLHDLVDITVNKIRLFEKDVSSDNMGFIKVLSSLVDVYQECLPSTCQEKIRSLCFDVLQSRPPQSEIFKDCLLLAEKISVFLGNDESCSLEAILSLRRMIGQSPKLNKNSILMFRTLQPILPIAKELAPKQNKTSNAFCKTNLFSAYNQTNTLDAIIRDSIKKLNGNLEKPEDQDSETRSSSSSLDGNENSDDIEELLYDEFHSDDGDKDDDEDYNAETDILFYQDGEADDHLLDISCNKIEEQNSSKDNQNSSEIKQTSSTPSDAQPSCVITSDNVVIHDVIVTNNESPLTIEDNENSLDNQNKNNGPSLDEIMDYFDPN
ncbi:hypothetical protein GJ496_002683 [Pomphorhynchus laevis]|nr:hypothetical protein GJ496_002683 [Pomphorhynchus laevis]